MMSRLDTTSKDVDLVVLDETGSDSICSLSESDVIILEDDNDDKVSVESEPCECCNKSSKIAKLKTEIELLKKKLDKCKAKYKLNLGPPSKPLVVVQFMTSKVADKYKGEVERLMKSLLKRELNYKDEERISGDDNDVVESEEENSFFIDTNGEDPSKKKKRKHKGPYYKVDFDEVMSDKVEVQDKEKQKEETENRVRNTCFNCGGDHLINECSKPMDQQQIAQNRKKFFSKFGSKQNRYHLETDVQNGKFRPGILSHELRKALNLADHQLPLHIYRMRVLGYPPGWLCEAKVESSGITIYNSDGKEEGENLEEGEVNEPGSIRIQYDPSKLIEYPGFNTYPSPGIQDEWEKLGFPPIQEQHLKSSFEWRMKPPEATPYKRRSDVDVSPQKRVANEVVDMEIEDDPSDNKIDVLPPLPEEPEPPIPPPPENTNEILRAASPSLDDLEERKLLLMKQLQQGDSSTPDPDCTVDLPRTVFRLTSKSFTLGTPIVESCTPYTKLPDSSKFAATISDHMNFENLPNSTGSFDKVKDILQKIRQKLSA